MNAGAFTRHMVAHMTLVALVAPLLAVLIAHSRFNPVERRPLWFSPIAASLIEFVVIWAWHAPVLHVAARHHGAMFALEQACFLGASTYLWLSIVGGDRASSAMRAGTGIVALVLTFAHMTMLGAVLALTPRDLYGHGGPAVWQRPALDRARVARAAKATPDHRRVRRHTHPPQKRPSSN